MDKIQEIERKLGALIGKKLTCFDEREIELLDEMISALTKKLQEEINKGEQNETI